MSTEKTSAEEAAEEFAGGEERISCDYCGHSYSHGSMIRSSLNGYERGKAEERKSIYEKFEKIEKKFPGWIGLTFFQIKHMVFGGGDE